MLQRRLVQVHRSWTMGNGSCASSPCCPPPPLLFVAASCSAQQMRFSSTTTTGSSFSPRTRRPPPTRSVRGATAAALHAAAPPMPAASAQRPPAEVVPSVPSSADPTSCISPPSPPAASSSLASFTPEGHAARIAFVSIVDRLVWASEVSHSMTGMGEEGGDASALSSSPSSSSSSASIFDQPPPTLAEFMACYTAASAELVDVIATATTTTLTNSTGNGGEGISSSSSSSSSSFVGVAPLNAACASFVNDLEAREAVVAFVEACARCLQCTALHRLVEEAASGGIVKGGENEEVATTEERASDHTDSIGAGNENPIATLIPTIRRDAIAAASNLLPHAAEAHDSVDEAIALLQCASAVLTLSPPARDKVAMRKLLVPAMVVSRRLVGSDLSTLLLCLSRTYDANANDAAASSSAAFLSYSTLTDLKSLELELFRRFDAAFAKYTAPPTRTMASGHALSADQREAHRRQFIAARRRALLTLTDVAEISTAFAIHRFIGSNDLGLIKKSVEEEKKRNNNQLSASASSSTNTNQQQYSANTSPLWHRIVQYAMTFISHDLRLGEEMKKAASEAEAAAMEMMMVDDGDLPPAPSSSETTARTAAGAEGEDAGDDDDDTIDTTFTKADIKAICFALDRVGCDDGYNTLMAFLVEKEILREAIPPPSTMGY